MNESVLHEAGLTQIEARVYMTLLEHGALLAGVISRKSGVHRRSVYDVMDRLIEKGLVSYIVKNNRRYYEATNPQRLLELLHERESEIQNALPELKAKYDSRKEKTETLFFRGKSGLKAVLDDNIDVGKEILLLAATDYWQAVNKWFFDQFDMQRKRKNIRMRVIFSKKKRGEVKIPLAQIRFLSQDYDTPVSMAVYGNHINIIMWTANPFAILIKEKTVADAYRTYFETLWKIAKP